MNYSVRVGEENFEIKNVKAFEGTADVNGVPARVALHHVRSNLYYLNWNGEIFTVQIDASHNEVRLGSHFFEVHVEDERSAVIKKFQRSSQPQSGLITIKAPMPGLIARVEVARGQLVKKAQGLVVVEAMKMENEIKSQVAGMVTEVMVENRMTVEKGAPLLQIKPE